MSALIFVNGALHHGNYVRRALDEFPNPFIIAADGGARLAIQHFDIQLNLVIGDMDSLQLHELAAFEAAGALIERYPAEKNETDLELALQWAVEHGHEQIRVIGAFGKRVDQTLGNLYLLALPQLQGCDVRLVSGEQAIWLARAGKHIVDGNEGDTLSLIPFGGNVQNISTEKLYYPLKNETLRFGPARGMSNVLTAKQASITFEQGLLFIVHTIGEAE